MRRVSSVDILMEEAFHAETILALWDRYVDPFFALSQAKAIFKAGRAQLPPANATFRLVWFLGKKTLQQSCLHPVQFSCPGAALPRQRLGSASADRGSPGIWWAYYRQILGHVVLPFFFMWVFFSSRFHISFDF